MTAAQPTSLPIGYHSSAVAADACRRRRAREQSEVAEDRDRGEGDGEERGEVHPKHAGDDGAAQSGDRRRPPTPTETGKTDGQRRKTKQNAGKSRPCRHRSEQCGGYKAGAGADKE